MLWSMLGNLEVLAIGAGVVITLLATKLNVI